MADRRDRLAGGEEVRDQAYRLGVGAQVVGVGDTAGEHEPVVVVDRRVGDGPVDGDRVGVVEMVERLDVARLGGQDLGLPTGRLDRLARLGQLDGLDPLVGHEKGDLESCQVACHVYLQMSIPLVKRYP